VNYAGVNREIQRFMAAVTGIPMRPNSIALAVGPWANSGWISGLRITVLGCGGRCATFRALPAN